MCNKSDIVIFFTDIVLIVNYVLKITSPFLIHYFAGFT